MRLFKIFCFIIFNILSIGCTSSSRSEGFEANAVSRKNVLIIGDSISIGYTPFVQTELPNGYSVSRISPPVGAPLGSTENARNTTYTLLNLDYWLSKNPSPHIVIWNNGIWNAFSPDSQKKEFSTSLEQYEKELIQIGTRLVSSGARILFFTTTKIPAEYTEFRAGYEVRCNEIAKRVLPQLGVEVYDLYTYINSYEDVHDLYDLLHFNDKGSSLLAKFIALKVISQP